MSSSASSLSSLGSSNILNTAQSQSERNKISNSGYVDEFNELFKPLNLSKLRDKALNGELRNSNFRSLCWRLFLQCLPDKSSDKWCEKCADDRQEYEEICRRHAVDPRQDANDASNIVACDNNPLSQDENSPWNQYFADSQLRNVIRQDVIRTFPDMEFFRGTEIQTILQNVLFHFARENTRLSYKQGMHELLASLLFVLHCDIEKCALAHQGGLANEEIVALLDIKYLEHDVYMTFNQLMQTIETWYQNDEILPSPSDSELSSSSENSSSLRNRSMSASATPANLQNNVQKTQSNGQRVQNLSHVRSVLGLKLKMISESIVKRHDCELYNHLEALQIAPQIFGIRWMRLLFGREFPFMDVLVMWDAIIGDGISFALTDYLFASMLIVIRELLVNSDYTDCLNYLMRYPPIKDIGTIIKFALHLREPQRYARPSLPYSAHRYLEQHQRLKQQQQLQQRQLQSQRQQSLNSEQKNANHKTANLKTANPSISNSNSIIKSLNANFQSTSNQNSAKKSGNLQRESNVKIATISGNSQQTPIVRSQMLKHQQARKMYSITPASPAESSIKSGKSMQIINARHLESPGSSSQTMVSPSSSSPRSLRYKQITSRSDSVEYDDLPSKVDYCWRLLSAQIESLQRCLPKEKNLNSEDEIYIALAQLKKVRDVLKGSLKLEDELSAQLKLT